MGPQLYRCGNAISKFRNPVEEFELQWGCNFIVAGICHVTACLPPYLQKRCFNGAATSLLRKYNILTTAGMAEMGLQWGRSFIVAEIPSFPAWSPGWSPRFNGAATLSLRKLPDHRYAVHLVPLASMGPQLYRCGNRPDAIRNPG